LAPKTTGKILINRSANCDKLIFISLVILLWRVLLACCDCRYYKIGTGTGSAFYHISRITSKCNYMKIKQLSFVAEAETLICD